MPEIAGRIDEDGAVVRVRVAIEEDDEDDRRARGMRIPSPMAVTALIDTGASRTAVHPVILDYLGITSHRTELVAVPGRTDAEEARLFDVRIAFEDRGIPAPMFDVEAVEAAPATRTVLVLVGRDVLGRCDFRYDGRRGVFRIEY